jgi:hypothetical protein
VGFDVGKGFRIRKWGERGGFQRISKDWKRIHFPELSLVMTRRAQRVNIHLPVLRLPRLLIIAYTNNQQQHQAASDEII